MQNRLVVEPIFLEEVHQGAATSGLGVGGAKVDLRDTGENDGARAHRAGLKRDVEARVFEAPTAEVRRGLRNGEDFGVRGGVLEKLTLVVRLADDLPIMDNDATDGNFAGVEGLFGFAEGGLHVARVFIVHGGGFCSVARAMSSRLQKRQDGWAILGHELQLRGQVCYKTRVGIR